MGKVNLSEYRRALNAAARLMELIEPYLKELPQPDKETAYALMNRFTSALADITPQDTDKYGIEVHQEDGEIWYNIGFQYHSKHEDNDE